MAVTFDELLKRAREQVAAVTPGRSERAPPLPVETVTSFRTQGLGGESVDIPLREDRRLDVEGAISRAADAVAGVRQPQALPAVGAGGLPAASEERPAPDVQGFLASIQQPAPPAPESEQGFFERSGRSIMSSFGRIGSPLVRATDQVVQAFESAYLHRPVDPKEFRYLSSLAEEMADPETYGYTPTPVWSNFKQDLAAGNLWEAAKTLVAGGVETGIASIPDLIFLLAAPLRIPYIASLSSKYTFERMENEARDTPTLSDIALGTATGLVVTQLEKFGGERVLGLVEREGVGTFLKRIWDAVKSEGLTEGGQAAVEDLLTRATTGKGITPGEFLDDVLANTIIGGTAGGVLSVPGAAARSVAGTPPQAEEAPLPEGPTTTREDVSAAVREAVRQQAATPPPAAPAAPTEPTAAAPGDEGAQPAPAEAPPVQEASPVSSTPTSAPPVAIPQESEEQAAQPAPVKPQPRAGTFPVQGYGRIPRSVAEAAYEGYRKAFPQETQTLAQIAARGGFGVQEMDRFAPGWRERVEGPEASEQRAKPREPETRIERQDLDTLAETEEGRTALRQLAERLREHTTDEAESTVLRLGALRVQSPRTRELLVEPLNQVFSRMPRDQRIDVVNALRSGDATALQRALGSAPVAAVKPPAGKVATPDSLLSYLNSVEAAPANRKRAAKLPERIEQLLSVAQTARDLPGLPEGDVSTLNKVVSQLTRWQEAPPERVRKGAVTTHAKVDKVVQTLRDVLSSLETEQVRKKGGERSQLPATRRVSEQEKTSKSESSTDEKLRDFVGRALKREAMESAGQDILDDLEEQNRSPRDVSKQFWKDVYFKLPGEVQQRFKRFLKNLSGWQPGDQIGVDEKGESIIARDWTHIAEVFGEDLPESAANLEGTERGYVALMEEAVRRASAEAAPQPKPAAATKLAKPSPKLKKISAGDYELTLGNRTVSITRFSKAQGASFNGWLARANWDKALVTDPVPTLQQARRAAEQMLKEGTRTERQSTKASSSEREVIKVKPKPITGRKTESLLSMLGMQIEPGQGRRAIDQLRKVLPAFNKATGRVFALVPSRDAKGNVTAPGAIPEAAYNKLVGLVYSYARSSNPVRAGETLKAFLDDIGEGKALDPETQAEVLALADQLRTLREQRLAEAAEEEPETDEERQLREIREMTEQTLPDEDIIRDDFEEIAKDLNIDAAANWRRYLSPSLADIITDRLAADYTELGMLGDVAAEAGVADLIRQAEAGTPLDVGEFMQRVAKGAARVATTGDIRYRSRAQRIAAIAAALAKLTPQTPLRFERRPDALGAFGVHTMRSLGSKTFDDEARIQAERRYGGPIGFGITIGGYDAKESPAAMMFTAMHEAAHAATVGYLVQHPYSPEAQALRDLYGRVFLLVQRGNGPLSTEHNAFLNEREFVVEVMTNPQFLRDLAAYDQQYREVFGEPRSILGKFVELLTRLLGLKPEDEPLVRAVSAAAWNVASAQQRDPAIQLYLNRAARLSRYGSPSLDFDEFGSIDNLNSKQRATYDAVSAFAGPATARLTSHGALAARDFASGVFGAARKAFLALHTMDQIERRHAEAFEGAGHSNPLKDLIASYRRRRAISTKLQEDAEKSFSRAWLELGARENERVGGVMRDSTLWQIDPTLPKTGQAPEAIRHPSFDRKYDEIKKAYDALTPEGKKIYGEARDYFKRMRLATRRATVDLVLDSYADFATKPITPELRRRVAAARGLKQLEALIGGGQELDFGDENATIRRALLKAIKMTDLSGPYFPLRRYGGYILSAKEEVDEGYATEAEARAAAERIMDEAPANDVQVNEHNGKWKVTGSRYELSLHNTRFEAEQQKERLAKKGIESYIGQKLDANPLGGNEGAIATLMAAVNRRLAGEPEAKKLVEMAFIEVMADRATYASSLMREGYAGVKAEDMRRALAERAVGAAWNIADMRTVLAETSALTRLRKAATDTRLTDDLRIRRSGVVNAMTRSRAGMLADRGSSAWDRAVSNFGYLRFLGDPAYAFVNLTQTPMVAYPTLAARYGYKRTFAAMRRAYRAVSSPTIINAIRGYARRPGNVTQYDLLSATMKTLEAHPTYKKYVPALQKLVDNDVIDATFTQELLSAARGGALGHSRWQRLLEYSKLLPQGTEFLNRFVTAIATLELTNGNVEKAADMVRLTQFDYTSENRPTAFRFPGARAILMFKMYSQGIGNLLISSFYDSIRRHSGRQEALRTLAGLIGTHSLAAGVLGGVMLEPLRWLVNAVLWASTDDEEQTPDIDTLVSNWAADTFGKRAGEVVARGLPMAFGLDLQRVSLANLIFYNRGQDWISPEGLVSLLGPLPQVAFDAARGVQDLEEGRYEAAAAKLIPIKLIADVSRAIQLKTRGITTGTGTLRVPPSEVGAGEVALTALGFTPRRVRLDIERRRIEAERQEFLTDTRGSLLRRWRQARNADERNAVLEDVRRFNRANPSNKIQMQDLVRSRREAERARRKSIGTRQKDRTLREQLRFLR